MGFHEAQFPTAISLGAEMALLRRTDIVRLSSGYEQRNTSWSGSLRRYNAGYGVTSLTQMREVIAFFEARRGPLHGFRWRDPFDYSSASADDVVTPFDQSLGLGDGATTVFQLVKTYAQGGETVSRVIAKPVAGGVRVAVDGVELSEGADFSVDATTGRVSFANPPGAGLPVTAGYQFDTPVRFETEELSFNLTSFAAGEAPNIPLIEVRL